MNNTESNRINICLSCDENYSQYAGVVIASILANAKAEDDIFISILDGNISESSKNKILSLQSIKDCSIEFVKVNETEFEDYKKINTHSYLSVAACYRLKIPSRLKNVDKIIYLDCNVIACTSLKSLFNHDLQSNIIGGSLDIDYKKNEFSENYINSGVLLIDLKQMRKQNVENVFLTYAQNNINEITMGDQEIINKTLLNEILLIDEKYNVQSESYTCRSSFTKQPYIVHFIGSKKPWHFGSWSVHKDLYFKYLQMTPWKLSDKEFFKWTTLNKFSSFVLWFKHRPFFYLQSKFWNAVKKDLATQDKPKIF